MRPEVVLAARWCHIRILMPLVESAALVFSMWSVDVFRLSCTVKKLCNIFGCGLKFGWKFAFETNFCMFDPCSDLIPQLLLMHIVYLAEMRILSYQSSWYVSAVPRYMRKRLGGKSPLTSPKWGVLGDNSPMGWDVSKRPPKGTSLAETDWCIICGTRALRVGCALAQQVTRTKKNYANRKFTYIGSRDAPADHYEFWPSWSSRQLSYVQFFLSVKRFFSTRCTRVPHTIHQSVSAKKWSFSACWKRPFLILSDHRP
jgi:hypothetical protein